ncbi:MAG: hypothetical protein Fur0032_03690 [Terrimicrobiaceae bacterium]
MAYNVENLFDIDGVSAYEDYVATEYGATEMLSKLDGIVEVLGKINDGKGPDILVFNEIELDQTPESSVEDIGAWLDGHAGREVRDLLLTGEGGSSGLAGVPAHVWLAKAIEDAGLGRYHVAVTDEKPGVYEDGRQIGVRNVIFSRYPITSVKTHRTRSARAILEAVLDVEGAPLTVFANHWKSGAGDPESEKIRFDNAQTLRKRLDQIFQENPLADVVVAGDLNSHYNQGRRYREMRKTGINDVLGSQGNELVIRGKDRDLYNLWFELPSDRRGSDIYRNEWGTLMHIILSRGLYDQAGLQYVDNSFSVVAIPDLNADDFGRPIRWNPLGGGYSDHFPLLAKFRRVRGEGAPQWMPLNRPSQGEETSEPRRVDFASVEILKSARDASKLPEGTDLQDGSFNGRVFKVTSPTEIDKRGVVRVQVGGKTFELYSHDEKVREEYKKRAAKDGQLTFYGELSIFKKRWQFLIHGKEWLVPTGSGKH